MLARVSGSAVSSEAAISLRAAFLAPLSGISPERRRPPRIRIRSMIPRKTPPYGGPACSLPLWNRKRLAFAGWGRRNWRVFPSLWGGFGLLRGWGGFAALKIGAEGRGQPFGG